MAYYESIYIVRPDITADQVEQMVARFGGLIETNGGKVLSSELWGRRDLAYPVKKTSKGFYIFQVLEGTGPMVRGVESQLRISEDVLKFIHVKVDNPPVVPSPLAAAPETSEAAPAAEEAAPAAETAAEKAPAAEEAPAAKRAEEAGE